MFRLKTGLDSIDGEDGHDLSGASDGPTNDTLWTGECVSCGCCGGDMRRRDGVFSKRKVATAVGGAQQVKAGGCRRSQGR